MSADADEFLGTKMGQFGSIFFNSYQHYATHSMMQPPDFEIDRC